jgi:hypothetical protein
MGGVCSTHGRDENFIQNFSRKIWSRFLSFSVWREMISLNSINQLIFVLIECCGFFAVRTEFLYIVYSSFGFKGLFINHIRVYNK